ncbi:hypothetical protein SteCoe_8946 [Stentor coeruleus]|uniref:Uncharacterized protein n=1 Tax=Stentor coeruleus TaxID=5963 RepID=A0A1R2CJ51_9CILI|nr:hypothetical protein SteCoe_8946 [Stentor coeruleus]
MESDLVSQMRSELGDYVKAKILKHYSLSQNNSLTAKEIKIVKEKLATPKKSKLGKKTLFLVKKSKPKFLFSSKGKDRHMSISEDKPKIKLTSSTQHVKTDSSLGNTFDLKAQLINQENNIKGLRSELEIYKKYKSLADSLQIELATAKETLKMYESTFGIIIGKNLVSSTNENNQKTEKHEIRSESAWPKNEKITMKNIEKNKVKNQEPQSPEKKPGIIGLLIKKIAEDCSMHNGNYDLEMKSLQEQCHNYKMLYESESLKTSKLQNDICFLKKELELLTNFTDNPNSMQLLQNKNIEYINLCLKNADSVFEKTIEIKAIQEQKDKILKEFLKKQEDVKEIPCLRQHITTLLELLRNLRSNIKKVADEHRSNEKDQEIDSKNDIVDKISKIAENSKINLIDNMKLMLAGAFIGKNNNII